MCEVIYLHDVMIMHTDIITVFDFLLSFALYHTHKSNITPQPWCQPQINTYGANYFSGCRVWR
jgi:hypothetical protein